MNWQQVRPYEHPGGVINRAVIHPETRSKEDLSKAVAAELERMLSWEAAPHHFVRQIVINCDRLAPETEARPKGSRYVVKVFFWPDPSDGGQP